jgi:hypothetical protein
LLQVVGALGTTGRFAGRLGGEEQEGDQSAKIAITTSNSISVNPR